MKQAFAFLALAAIAQAAQVTFHVIAPGSTTVQVSVNGQLTALTAADPTIPVFSGAAETGADTKYKYVAGGVTETFDRALPTGRTETYNDFLNRPVTYADIPELPSPIEKNPTWTRSGPKQPLFDTNYIPTIFVNGNPSDLNGLIVNPAKDKFSVTLTFVLASEVKTFTNIRFGIHGAGKKKNNAKQSWIWELAPNDTYQNRNFFKLRHQEEDPTQMREKLYADISRAMGTYANEANMIRFFINNEAMGTFNIPDDITQYSYPPAKFYAGKPPAQMNALFDGASGASFHKTDKANDAAIAEVGKLFDIDTYMRFMVLEYLTGNWDGCWEQQTNVGLYRQDFDATFGVNIHHNDTTFIEWSYKKYPTLFPGGVMINGLLQNPTYTQMFETYLKNTVQILFNNATLINRILKYHAFILPDFAENLWGWVPAPNANGGGAGFGLIQWIVRKSEAVAKEFAITTTPTPDGDK
ncbi:hypothetical protein BGX27_003762 [Mortierella sp. AM989]|nr:hypothetical protein BGX27_003762 [Mortierella sp. AM989]